MNTYLVKFYFHPLSMQSINLHVQTIDDTEEASRMVRYSVRKGRVDGYSPVHGGPMSVYITGDPELAYLSMSEVKF